MRQLRKSTVATLAGLGALAIAAAPGFADSKHRGAMDEASVLAATPQVQLAHMGGGRGAQGQPGYGMGPGMMGPGQGYGPGHGYGMGPGMMGPGQGYGPGHGYGMGMGPGQGYGPNPGYGMGPDARSDLDLSADDVRTRIERSLNWHGNKRIKVGDVTEADDDTITADIVTQDGSLVQRFKVDRHSGQMQQAE